MIIIIISLSFLLLLLLLILSLLPCTDFSQYYETQLFTLFERWLELA